MRHDPTFLSMQDAQSPIAFLRSPLAIRQRCDALLQAGLRDELAHFAVDESALPRVIERVVRVTRRRYPEGRVPLPSRLDRLRLGGHDRLGALRARLASSGRDETARVLFEVAITSILMGAGAGSRWRYRERDTGLELGRTEGLALASFHAYATGTFSSDPSRPLRADADALDLLESSHLARMLDVRADNPIDGLVGRTELLSQLGSAMRATPHLFGEEPRLGHLYDAMKARAGSGASLPARRVLALVLEAFAPIWPSRHSLLGVNLGDVWPHPAAGGAGPSAGFVPFHTFSLWITYSLLAVLAEAGLRVEAIDELPGLSEYRTCGLFVDDGVLVPRRELDGTRHSIGSELIVEWRALSLALLDRVATGVRTALLGEASDDEARVALPLPSVIEGGTWAAGREAARERRADGSPPIEANTDGTVV